MQTPNNLATGYLVIFLVFYFLPTVVAALRRHHNATAICLLNLLLGWTALGWLIALIWSATATQGRLPRIELAWPRQAATAGPWTYRRKWPPAIAWFVVSPIVTLAIKVLGVGMFAAIYLLPILGAFAGGHG
jgi:hypothetical protein